MTLAVLHTKLISALALITILLFATASLAFPQQTLTETEPPTPNNRNPPCVCIPAERNGEPYLDWAAWYFKECLYTHTERLGFYLGLATIVIWSFAQLPQFWESYRLKRVEGISPGFIVQWLTGDTTNLIGCILTNQLETQLYTAIFFCLSDVFLVAQYCYYRFWYRQRRASSNANTERQPLLASPTSPTSPASQKSYLCKTHPVATRALILAGTGGLFGLIIWAWTKYPVTGPDDDDRLEICDAEKELEQWQTIVGIIAAWGSGMLYFFSRIPQLFQNRRRKSVYGLSLLMFVLAITANITYGASILLRLSKIDAHFWQSTLPFLIGSLGTLFSDFGIMIQAAIYGCEPPADEIEGQSDEISPEAAT